LDAGDIATALAALVALYLGSVAITVGAGVAFCAWAERRYRAALPLDDAPTSGPARARASPFARARGLVVEIVCQAFALVLRGAHQLRLLPPPRIPSSGTPVLLLPGYVENAGTMWWLARRLARAGFRTVLIEFPSTTCAIEQNVGYLARRVAEISADSGGSPLAVVAHSMGGVITRTLMLSREDHGVLTLVALGSPFRGTHLARIGARLRFGHCVGQIVPGSTFLERFPPTLPCPVPTLSLIAPQENIVSPLWSAAIAGAHMRVLAEPYGHEAPLFVSSVADDVAAWLLAHGVTRATD